MANQPIVISTGGIVVVTNPNVIITGIVPVSLTWSKTAFVSYSIYNNTSATINLASGIYYIDVNGQKQTTMAPQLHLDINGSPDGQWVQQAASSPTPPPTEIPIATATILGGIKVGNNLDILPDGTLSAELDGQVQSDWNESNNLLPSFVQNKPVIPAAQIQSNWTQGSSSALDYIKNKPSIPSPYTLPIASSSTLGGVKVGANLAIDGSGVLSANPSSSVPTGLPSASTLGILANGTDQTATINSVLLNANYAGILFDFVAPSSVTITGTVNGGGKVLRFVSGNKIIGNGTLNNCCYDANYLFQIFDIAINHTNAKVSYGLTSVKWFGAIGNGSIDDQPFLQKASDVVIANTTLPRNLYLPGGNYKITQPWILYSWSGTLYNQVNINLIGEEGLYGAPGIGVAKIIPNFNDTFAIGIQRAAGGIIRGIFVQGTYTTAGDLETFVTTTFASRSTARDSRYSPNAGIVIDPFGNSVSLPADGGYPGLSSWYRGTGATSGTTGFRIYDCKVEGFTVGICNSPSGQTQQGEDCIIEDTQVNYAKVAIAYCQSQSDRCLVRNTRHWYYVDLVFDTGSYGAQQGVMANIEGVNIAGVVNKLFNITTINKAVSINEIHAESFYKIGTLAGGNISLGGCTLHLSITPNDYQPMYHFDNITNVQFISCRLGYYGGNPTRLRIATGNNCLFEECVLYGGPPWFQHEGDAQFIKANFINTKVEVSQTIGPGNSSMLLQIPQEQFVMFGRFTLQDATGLEWSSGGGIYAPVGSSVYCRYDCTTYDRIIYTMASAVSVTIAVDRSATVAVANASLCRISDLVLQHGGSVFGEIGAVNIGAGTINIRSIPIGFSSGTYSFDICYFLYSGHPFVGDTTNGSALITSVSPIWADPAVGDRVDHPVFPLGAYITAYNTGTRVITMSVNANKTAGRVDFVNGRPTVEIYSRYPPQASYNNAFPGGATWIELPNSGSSSSGVPIKWLFNKGGYISASTIGLGSSYQADLNILPNFRVNAGVIQYYDSPSDAWINV